MDGDPIRSWAGWRPYISCLLSCLHPALEGRTSHRNLESVKASRVSALGWTPRNTSFYFGVLTLNNRSTPKWRLGPNQNGATGWGGLIGSRGPLDRNQQMESYDKRSELPSLPSGSLRVEINTVP